MMLPLFIGEIVVDGLGVEPFYTAELPLGVFVFLFSAALIVASEMSRHVGIRLYGGMMHRPVVNAVDMAAFRLAFAFAVIVLIVVFKNSGKLSGAHWAAHSGVGFFGSLAALVALVLRAYFYAFSLSVLRVFPRETTALLVSFTVLDVVLTGNRISVLYFFFAVFFSRVFRPLSLLLLSVALTPGVIFFVSLYPAFRGVVWNQFGGFTGFYDAFQYVVETSGEDAFKLSKIYNMFEGANVAVFQYIFNSFGVSHEFLYGETVLLKPLTFYVPRQIWASKPLGLGSRLGGDVFGADGLSLNSLLMGEFYANFGWWSPLLALFIFGMVLVFTGGFRVFHTQRAQHALFLLAFSAWRHEFNYLVFGAVMLIPIQRLILLFARIRICWNVRSW